MDLDENCDLIIGVKHFQVVKFDGDPPPPGEKKEPAEIIEGGDDVPTRVTYRRGQHPTVLIEG
jgi:hypothetical protein